MTLTLYEIGAQFAALDAALTESGGEWTDEIEAQFAALGELEGDKADAYAVVIRQQEAYAKAVEEEAAYLDAKAQAARNTARRLKDRLLVYMQARDVPKLQGKIWTLARQANGGKTAIEVQVPPEELPTWCQRVTVSADVEAMRRELTDGKVVDSVSGTTLAVEQPRGEHVRIR